MPRQVKEIPSPPSPLFPASFTRGYENQFGIIFFVTFAAFMAAGLYLKTIKPLPVRFDEKKASMITTQFVVEETRRVPPKPKPKIEKQGDKKEAIDLTKSPLLGQKQDFTVPQAAQQQTGSAVARPVYGLRRVYSVGLGAGGSMAEAVIGKRGNTLDKEVDTLTPNAQDIKGRLVSVTTVTVAPRLKHEVKPEYTKEMLAAKVEGVVKAELLVDVDGKVKEVKIKSDLGFGTAGRAREAFLQWEFEPATVDGKPVATWISFSIRFVLVQE